jgi:hypothetical protein
MPPPTIAGTPNTTKVPNLLLMFILNPSPLNLFDYQKGILKKTGYYIFQPALLFWRKKNKRAKLELCTIID